jgi:hypothetical protein
MIFDDYELGGPDQVKRGVDAFVDAYWKRVVVVGTAAGQVAVRKERVANGSLYLDVMPVQPLEQ